MDQYEINIDFCRSRQKRLLAEMQTRDIDLIIVTQAEHVQWLTGPRFAWTFQPAAAMSSEGHVTLAAPNQPPEIAAADEVVCYEAQWYSTLRNDQRQASSEALVKAISEKSKPRRVGVEYSSFGQHLAQPLDAELVDIEPDLYRLRRYKDPDELARIKMAIAGTAKMYARARQIIEPGITELDVFNQLQTAAVEECGEMLTGAGNDYQCGSRGGPPRGRRAEDGELYILDLGHAFRGYFADNARTIAVNGKPTEQQHRAWQQIMKALEHIGQTVKPGMSCKELFNQVQAILDEAPLGVFNHHLGHGMGLFPHEAPHLNPNWDDTFEVGDVFTCEPGLYASELKVGIRIEQNYRVGEDGIELLTEFPLEL